MNFSEYFYDQLKIVLKSSKQFSHTEVRLVFLAVLKDFLDKKITTNFLSSASAQLYYELNKPSDFNSNNTSQSLGNALDDAEELEYYQENKDKNESDKKMYEGILKNLKEYFKENKDLLKPIKP